VCSNTAMDRVSGNLTIPSYAGQIGPWNVSRRTAKYRAGSTRRSSNRTGLFRRRFWSFATAARVASNGAVTPDYIVSYMRDAAVVASSAEPNIRYAQVTRFFAKRAHRTFAVMAGKVE